jgi:hypothetical protein
MDGNGRMGRLWQSLILCRLHPVFEYLPVENIVYQNQRNYYKTIQQSTQATDCSIFIEFIHCRISFVSKNTAIPVKTIEIHVMKLRDPDKIEFAGSKKTGGYYIKKIEKGE